ncbi:MAG: ABC transporter ATP-binding protein [Candidatus Sericytochromatia bacterium]|uniref:ABC transporter ATP-binding protein n=1 Tax=Candidatus Tanganyikabacteria bacterium TaxID=2961651 RepID=A0A937X1S1_9BACT|nr:ABC transporter ATP-binding protein [Candidatus Tanganyikabacteria bacterium]
MLSRQYGAVTAVEDLDLEVRAGEVLGFLGPNGAGKTTVTRMLSGLIAPTKGTAIVLGHDVEAGAEAVRRGVGVLTEATGLYKRLTARENLRFYAGLYGVNRIDAERRIDHYLRRLDLKHAGDRPVATYSKGMGQKVAIIRALLHEPRLVFLDEPTAGLDVESARTVRDFILTLKDEGRTVFLCTHHLDEAERVCDRVAIFKRRIIAMGDAHRLRQDLAGRKVVVRLASRAEADLLERVTGLPFVEDAQLREDGDLVATLNNPEVETPELVRLLVEGGGRVQAVRPATASLEEVYLKLVENGPSSAASGRKGEA